MVGSLRNVLVLGALCASGWLAGAGSAGAQAFPLYPGSPPTKSADAPVVDAGGVITWTITIIHDAFPEPATVVLADDVPDPADSLPVEPWSTGEIVRLPPGAIASYTGDRLSVDMITIAGGSSETLVFRTRVSPTAPDGTQICNSAFLRYTVEVCGPQLCEERNYQATTWPPGGTQAGPTCVTVRAPSPGVNALQSATTYADRCPQDPGFPAPDQAISPGETLDLTLAIHNTGSGDASASPRPITGTLSPGPGFTILNGASDYSTTVRRDTLLANSGNEGTNVDPFTIRVDPDFPCPGTLTLELVVSNITGGPYTVQYSFPVTACASTCLAAPLSAGTPSFQDSCAVSPPGGNGAIDPGESLRLTLPVSNAGPDDLVGAPSIQGTLTSLTGGVAVIGGQDVSAYPDLAAGTTQTNATPFGVLVDASVPCGRRIDLRLTLTGTSGGTRTVDYRLDVAQPCTVCNAAPCSASPQATTTQARYCVGDTTVLDGSGSSLTGCSGSALYQWSQGGTPIPGATSATYTVPATQPAGSYSYTLTLTCSADPGCSAVSAPLAVTIDPLPVVVRSLLAVKSPSFDDAVFTWPVEPTATGGYRLYWTEDKTLLDQEANATTAPPAVSLAGSTGSPTATTLTHTGVVRTPPSLMHYQLVAVCSDGVTEGPNE